ncbi:MAG: hypothetical protein H6R01_454 [Burkholderiaceae bacterium]|nr:hypothetical protein [Burkholderiaceae bacterium]
MRLYISGPMTGLPDYNRPAFHAAAAILRDRSYHVQNPAENPAPECGSWPAYMRMALRQMLICDAIVLLPGWENSRGATEELRVAMTCGMTVFQIEHFSEVPRG